MGMTRPQLLASLGARGLSLDQVAVSHAVEDQTTGVRITGDVGGTPDGTYVEAVICYGTATRGNLPVCIFQAIATAGRFTPISFLVGNVPYLSAGRWSVFTEADACALVRACMRELEAGRLPDLDELLTVCSPGARLASIDWGG